MPPRFASQSAAWRCTIAGGSSFRSPSSRRDAALGAPDPSRLGLGGQKPRSCAVNSPKSLGLSLGAVRALLFSGSQPAAVSPGELMARFTPHLSLGTSALIGAL